MKNLQEQNHYIAITLIIIALVDQGDGHWKERDKENLRHDIEVYRKTAEKIDQEIETFYNEYQDETLEDYSLANIHKLKRQHEDSNEKTNSLLYKKHNLNLNRSTNKSIHKNNKMSNKLPFDKFRKAEPWPTFEDIVSAMGKKYDWKNDRWIKVKVKLKESAAKEKIHPKLTDNKSVVFHEKHKFSYRMIKLKSKSRRNVVVAVSAVR